MDFATMGNSNTDTAAEARGNNKTSVIADRRPTVQQIGFAPKRNPRLPSLGRGGQTDQGNLCETVCLSSFRG